MSSGSTSRPDQPTRSFRQTSSSNRELASSKTWSGPRRIAMAAGACMKSACKRSRCASASAPAARSCRGGRDQRALAVQRDLEPPPPRRGSDQALPQRFEDRLEGDEVRGTIVDEQDGGRRVVHRSTLQPWPLKCANLSDQTSAHARLFQGPPIERVFGPTFEWCMPLASTRSTLPRRWREAQSSENDDGRCRRQITSAPAAA